MTIPRATYRFQFHPGFTFLDAAALTDYLADLGISHLYASPYLQAVKGSTHGYDVVDPGRVNEELGGEEGHQVLCAALQEQGLGQILDLVPNHMAIGGPENEWWWDVLENGPSSPYAAYFDVDWNPPEERLANKILLPVLGDHYGRSLESGEILLVHAKGGFSIHYHDHRFPLAPDTLPHILDRIAGVAAWNSLAFISDSLRQLPLPRAHEFEDTRRRRRNWTFIRALLGRVLEESPAICAAVDKTVEEFNNCADLLDALLNEQHYRLAFWRAAARDLGYRRFFDINTLIGMRMEEQHVFADTHQRILQWLQEGIVDGLRIDHPDGLRDPERYLKRLRAAAPEAWIVVEKILHPGEELPSSWPVAGTTGYDFLNLLGHLFIDPAGETPMTDFYAEFTAGSTDYAAITREKKHQVLHELLASDVNRLTDLMVRICEQHRRFRDYTRWEINEALRELVACFPVYRTYVREEQGPTEADRKFIDEAAKNAQTLRPELDPELFDFFRTLLFRQHRGQLETEWVMRFQQLTGPATAKGIEDTAFYNFNRLIGLNEVGGDPGRFGVSVEDFHQAMMKASNLSPHAMLTTSTHDTKRSEDVRARLALLSEIPGRWAETVRRWSVHNEKYRQGNVPDRNAEYLFYQTLAGAWPIEAERALAFMQKASREARVYTSWTEPDAEYEQALLAFVQAVLADREFRCELENFVSSLVDLGRVNALSQVLIKLVAPGVPDFYQGTELWDLSLVDPDNRRPVDFALRRRLLAELSELSPEQIMTRMDEGMPKLWIMYQALDLRRRLPKVFRCGDYRPLNAQGRQKKHAVAFLRGESVAAITPRLLFSFGGDWQDTWLEIPDGRWHNHLTGDSFRGGRTMLRDILARFPLALVSRE